MRDSTSIAAVVVCGAAVALFAGSTRGQSCPPVALNTNAITDGGDDDRPRLATDGIGTIVAVWVSDDSLNQTIGTDIDILFARSLDNGVTWSAPAALNTNAADDSGNDLAPTVLTDGAGTWIAAWYSNSNIGGIGIDTDVLFARSFNGGLTWSAPAVLNTNAAFDSGSDPRPRLATDGAGRWVAAWESADTLGETIGFDFDILVATSDDDGLTWSDPAPLNTNAGTDTGHDGGPVVATDNAGTWIATWHSNDDLDGSLGADRDILYAVSTDDGASWSDPAPLNSGAPGGGGNDWSPELVYDGLGAWMAVWYSDEAGDFDIVGASSSDNGATWTPEGLVSLPGDGEDLFPHLTSDGNGMGLVVWESGNSLGGTIGVDQDIMFATSIDGGVTWSAPGLVNANAAGDVGSDVHPFVVTDGAGTWLAAWASRNSLGGTVGTDQDIHTTFIVFDANDCNANGIVDECELPDCNGNFVPDDCDILDGFSTDCNANGIPDECEIGFDQDCNGNGNPDLCDLAEGLDTDCNANDIPDGCDIDQAVSIDCNANGLPDECEIPVFSPASGGPFYCAIDCDPDCNSNGIPDECDAAAGVDCNRNGIPDACDAAGVPSPITAPAPLNSADSDTGTDNYPHVAAGDSTFVAVWQSAVAGGGSDYDIAFARGTDVSGELVWGDPGVVNSDSEIDPEFWDRFPRVATDGQGTWVTVWQRTGLPWIARYSRSTDDGLNWSPVQLLASNPNYDSGIRVATDGAGVWVAVLSRRVLIIPGVGVYTDIFACRSTDGGATWSAPEPVYSSDPPELGSDSQPFVAVAGGTWLVVWRSTENLDGIGTDGDLLYVRSTDGALSWSAPQVLYTTFSNFGLDLQPRLVGDGTGRWLAVWPSDEDVGGIGADYDIVVARSDDDGLSWSAPQPLNTSAALDTVDDLNAFVATDRSGNWIVTWASTVDPGGGLGSDLDILSARSTDNGATWSVPGPLNTSAPTDVGGDTYAALATDGAGRWAVVWYSNETFGNLGLDSDVFVADFDLTPNDCNGNDVPDDCDQDLNGNGIPDECEAGCPWDCADGDGIVGIVDFLALLAQWGQVGTSCDFDGDGVGITDFLTLLGVWGPCP